MQETILILGATSSIARAIARCLAAQGKNLYLAARDAEELTRISQDIKLRYAVQVNHAVFDAELSATHADFWQNVLQSSPNLTGIIFAFGYTAEKENRYDYAQIQKVITSNFSGAICLLELAANYFASKEKGCILALSSVSGDRGRQSNYPYGAAKAALNTYLQGLRNRLHFNKVEVITVKLGFVDTPMTFGLPGLFLVADPNAVAKRIVKLLNAKRITTSAVYIPWFWRYIMLIIRMIPETFFKRLHL